MMAEIISLVESERANSASFAYPLQQKDYDVRVYSNVDGAIRGARQIKPKLLIIDAASMRTSGTRMCKKASEKLEIPIILVSPEGRKPKSECGASVNLVHPFTPRKLLNRVTRYLPNGKRRIEGLGPLQLDLASRTVIRKKKVVRLTPKQFHLLKLLADKAGEVVTRETIMRKVWHTEYMGDTRTLDVHINFLRKSIERDPCEPELIKTIRGVGYRLDIPE